ncbi:hypothetical protein F2P45_11450 [Massilia sp. CCM 8733]|uniref:Uncharacterized protein n=1 Tax=Massilia mucilaginosa TaxID=2609282 RepID=A0ABX0NS93_9BURK|nr:hypothetical protein [Massilia mucilaginosa]NHZ89623.1 hypothetical protein [Massilia mucilaginosa]
MEAIRIRHCRLRLLRHGGWSWGADPRRLVAQATQHLPAWLMRALAAQLADCAPDQTIERLHLRIPVRLSELCDWPADAAHQGGDAPRGALAQRAQTILAEALKDVPRQLPASSHMPETVPAQNTASELVSPTTVTDTLTTWQHAGSLTRMLATADGATLQVWAREMLAELGATGAIRARAGAALVPLIERIEGTLGDPGASAAALADEIDLLVAALVSLQARASADQAGGGSAPSVPARPLADATRAKVAADRAPRGALRSPDLRPRVSPARQPRRESVVVESVLPFIVMGILSRRNYFAGLRAALACSALLAQSGCFAAALAYKLAPPPSRGWARSAATERLAAVMCGRDEAPDNARMDDFLRGLSSACAPLDASLWPTDRAARTGPGVLVERLEGGVWAVLDIGSSQPLGWFGDPDGVLRVADLLPGQMWWLAPGVADCVLPEALGRRGLRAIAMGASPRAAGWRSAGDGLWTNEPLLRRHSAQLHRVFDEAHELITATHSEFIEQRPLVLPNRGHICRAAEFSITLALCSALGDLADTLWREREPTQPLLALRRFGDLGGTVSIEEGRVLVRPALGRRFMDLSEHGLLRDIVDIPWWPGRRIEFAGP